MCISVGRIALKDGAARTHNAGGIHVSPRGPVEFPAKRSCPALPRGLAVAAVCELSLWGMMRDNQQARRGRWPAGLILFA
jgi:hypothetical protein